MPLDQPPAVQEVIITAARLPEPLAAQAFSDQRLSAEDLHGYSRLDEALTAIPGVSLFRRTSSLSSNPTTQGIGLRQIAPSGAGRALVLLDGVPQNDPFGGWVIWSQMAPQGLTGAQIVRGAGAGPYGAGALTGVISLTERDAGQAVDVSIGERGGGTASGAGVLKLDGAQLFASVGYDRSDGYIPVRGGARGAADTRTFLAARSGAVRLDTPTPLGVISIRAGGYRDDQGAGLAGAEARASGDSFSATLAKAPSKTALGWRIQVWRRDSNLFNSSVAVPIGRAFTTPANSQDKTPAVGQGINLALRHSAGALEWEVGGDARFNDGQERERFKYLTGQYNSQRVAGGKTSVAGAYVDGAWTAGPWLVAGGLRLDQWKNRDGFRIERSLLTGAVALNDHPADRSGQVLSGRLGVRRQLWDGLSLRGAVYSGFRPASLNELHRPFRVGNDITESNPGLKPERLRGAEVGVAAETRQGAAELTAFWNRIEDPIANVTIGFGPGTFPRAGFVPAGGVLRERRNIAAIDAIGVEARVKRELGPVQLRAAAAITDARVDGAAAAPQLTGKRPAQAPIWSATAGLSAPLGTMLRLDLDATYDGKRFEDDLNSRVLDAAARLDAKVSWRIRPDVQAYLDAYNLLNGDTQVARSVDGVASYGAPRTVRVGLTLTR